MALERFTLIGATTRFGLLTPPMRARFGLVERLAYYPPDDLAQIISRSAGILDVPTDVAGIAEIARRSRGTPRVANRLLKRVRDYAQVRAGGKITAQVAAEALKRLDVDEFGLDDMDGRILRRSSSSSRADPWASRPSLPRWARTRGHSRRCTSRSSCSRVSSRARRAAAVPRRARTSILASVHPRALNSPRCLTASACAAHQTLITFFPPSSSPKILSPTAPRAGCWCWTGRAAAFDTRTSRIS